MQLEQNIFENDETRVIMNKKRKRVSQVEDVSLNDLFSQEQVDHIFKNLKRPKLSDEHIMVPTTQGISLMPSSEEKRPVDLNEGQIVKQFLQSSSLQASDLLKRQEGESEDLRSTRLASLKELCHCIIVTQLTDKHVFQAESLTNFLS